MDFGYVSHPYNVQRHFCFLSLFVFSPCWRVIFTILNWHKIKKTRNGLISGDKIFPAWIPFFLLMFSTCIDVPVSSLHISDTLKIYILIPIHFLLITSVYLHCYDLLIGLRVEKIGRHKESLQGTLCSEIRSGTYLYRYYCFNLKEVLLLTLRLNVSILGSVFLISTLKKD
jgi:hypothetical protein